MKKILFYFSLFLASLFPLLIPAYALGATFDVSLGYGSTNTFEVIKLQNFLISQGLLKATATGKFLSMTQQAVTDYQKANGVTPASGYFGPLTRAVVNSKSVASVTPAPKDTSVATVSAQSVTSNQNNTAGVIMAGMTMVGTKTIKWQTAGYPASAGVNINLLRKVSDSPKSFVLVRTLFTNTPNDSQETWTPQANENGNDLYVEVTCSSTYKFSGSCKLSGDPMKVN